MKPRVQSVGVTGESSRKGSDLPSEQGRQSNRRMRLLVFACNADDAQHLLKNGDRVEVTYLPSYDMAEIKEEIERFRPDLVLCGANVLVEAPSGLHTDGASFGELGGKSGSDVT